jgi:hypothetical protein
MQEQIAFDVMREHRFKRDMHGHPSRGEGRFPEPDP